MFQSDAAELNVTADWRLAAHILRPTKGTASNNNKYQGLWNMTAADWTNEALYSCERVLLNWPSLLPLLPGELRFLNDPTDRLK